MHQRPYVGNGGGAMAPDFSEQDAAGYEEVVVLAVSLAVILLVEGAVDWAVVLVVVVVVVAVVEGTTSELDKYLNFLFLWNLLNSSPGSFLGSSSSS